MPRAAPVTITVVSCNSIPIVFPLGLIMNCGLSTLTNLV
jgi:hypothetical protein